MQYCGQLRSSVLSGSILFRFEWLSQSRSRFDHMNNYFWYFLGSWRAVKNTEQVQTPVSYFQNEIVDVTINLCDSIKFLFSKPWICRQRKILLNEKKLVAAQCPLLYHENNNSALHQNLVRRTWIVRSKVQAALLSLRNLSEFDHKLNKSNSKHRTSASCEIWWQFRSEISMEILFTCMCAPVLSQRGH